MSCSISSSALLHATWLCAKELVELEQEQCKAEDGGRHDEPAYAELQDYHLSVWKLYTEMARAYVHAYNPQSNMMKPSYFLDIYPVYNDEENLLWQDPNA